MTDMTSKLHSNETFSGDRKFYKTKIPKGREKQFTNKSTVNNRKRKLINLHRAALPAPGRVPLKYFVHRTLSLQDTRTAPSKAGEKEK